MAFVGHLTEVPFSEVGFILLVNQSYFPYVCVVNTNWVSSFQPWRNKEEEIAVLFCGELSICLSLQETPSLKLWISAEPQTSAFLFIKCLWLLAARYGSCVLRRRTQTQGPRSTFTAGCLAPAIVIRCVLLESKVCCTCTMANKYPSAVLLILCVFDKQECLLQLSVM